MSGRSFILTTLFLGRHRPPKRLTSTSCTYFRQLLTTALLEKAEGETKVCGQTGYRTQDPWLTSQVPYRLRYVARLGASVTYWAKRWLTDLAVPGSSPTRGEIFTTVNGVPLHTAFHNHPPMTEILLKTTCNCKSSSLSCWSSGPRLVVVLVFYVHGKHLRSCQDGQLT